MTTQLEGDEIRPTLELTPEQIAELEAERESLRGRAGVVRKSDKRGPRGEGSALEPEPATVVSIRSRMDAQRAQTGESEPVASEYGRAPDALFTVREQRRKLNVDALKLSQLVAAAQKTADESAFADEMAESAGAAARTARAELDAYLEESGLAG